MKKFLALFSILFFAACSGKSIKTGPEGIAVLPHPPTEQCKYLGEITGMQTLEQPYTEAGLQDAAILDLKTNAYNLGANSVKINRIAGTKDAEGKTTAAVVTGAAYECSFL